MKQVHKNRLLKLAKFLMTVPNEHFDLSVITHDNSDEFGSVYGITDGELTKKLCKLSKNIKLKGCGAVACAMGWCPAVFPNFVKWDVDADIVPVRQATKDNFDNYGWAALEAFFGLKTERQSEYLFQTKTYPNRDNTTAIQVAQRIRQVVKNGFPEFADDYPLAYCEKDEEPSDCMD